MATHRVISGRRYQSHGSRAEKREARTYDNICFDSILEMVHYRDKLKPLHNAHKIYSLQYHPVFVFWVNDIEVGSYEADFSYVEMDTDIVRVQDVKAWERDKRTGQMKFITGESYLWQKPLMRVCFGIDVEEV